MTRPKRTHALTLIQLIVVVGIIAILAAMLLPALNEARERARAVSCMPSMRGVGLAVAMYTSHFEDWLMCVPWRLQTESDYTKGNELVMLWDRCDGYWSHYPHNTVVFPNIFYEHGQRGGPLVLGSDGEPARGGLDAINGPHHYGINQLFFDNHAEWSPPSTAKRDWFIASRDRWWRSTYMDLD